MWVNLNECFFYKAKRMQGYTSRLHIWYLSR